MELTKHTCLSKLKTYISQLKTKNLQLAKFLFFHYLCIFIHPEIQHSVLDTSY